MQIKCLVYFRPH